MPLAFQSLSHGTVAFGFFHIETDMLLLDRLFFWAEDFSSLIGELAQAPDDAPFQADLPGFEINNPRDLGDLHGAISGYAPGGFLGALYRLRPFPRKPGEFKQKPRGDLDREVVLAEMAACGSKIQIPIQTDPAQGVFSAGSYIFNASGLRALVDYVWRGGMPGWQDGQRPAYLTRMAETLRGSPGPWFQGLALAPDQVGALPS